MRVSRQQWRQAFDRRVQFSISIIDLAAVLLVAILAVPVAEHFGVSSFALTRGGHFADVRAYLHNPLAYFMQRSPGARGSQGLIQTKHAASRALARVRQGQHEQVLSNVRYAPSVPGYVGDLVPNVAPTFLATTLPTPAVSSGGFNGIIPAAPSPIVPFVFPSGSSGPGGGTGTGTSNGSAVPEPSTWLMLIWGMALVGLGLRAKQRHFASGAALGSSPKR